MQPPKEIKWSDPPMIETDNHLDGCFHVRCLGCGEVHLIPGPIAVQSYDAQITDFEASHAACEAKS